MSIKRLYVGVGQFLLADEASGSLLVSDYSSGQLSSGTAAKATTNDTPVEVLSAEAQHVFHHLRITNTGTAAGFYSRDGGRTWNYLPAGAVGAPVAMKDDGVRIDNQAVLVKRVAGGDNLSGIFASAW